MQIIDLQRDRQTLVRQAAALLVAGFKEQWPEAWPDLAAALHEMDEALAPDRICRAALDDAGDLIGWVGGIQQYDGNVWELHPLVVKPELQRQGIGRLLVADFEEQVRQRGGCTIWLGTDDDSGETSLSGVDLYPDVFAHIANIRNFGKHPFTFYQKQGFVIVGVMPDANGPGRPDIFMAKRVRG